MKKSLIILSILLISITGLIYFIPTTDMGSMTGIMTEQPNDCLSDCLQNNPIDIENSVTLPIMIKVVIGLVAFLCLVVLIKFQWSIEKVNLINPFYLFKTINLKE